MKWTGNLVSAIPPGQQQYDLVELECTNPMTVASMVADQVQ